MAQKKRKKAPQKQPAYTNKTRKPAKKAMPIDPKKQKRNTIITIAVISLITVAAIAGLCVYALNQDVVDADGRYDYFQNKVSKYVSMDNSLYKSPEVTLPSYLNGDENAVAKYIEYLCKENEVSTGNKITDRPIQEGDTVALYYEGWKDGEKFSGGSNMDSSTPHSLKIGSGSFIPGFEDALIGIIPANTSKENMVDLNLTFPEDYHNTELAGKDVIFKVYVLYIDEKTPAEYNEKFITDTFGYSTTESDVKAAFEKYLKDEYLPSLKKQEIQNAVWEKMTENAKIKGYPKGEVDRIYSNYESEYKQYYEQYFTKTYSSFEVFMTAYYGSGWKTQFEEQSKNDVAKNLIYHYIAQNEGMTVSEEEYDDAIQYFINYYAAQGQQMSSADVEYYYGESGVKEYVIAEKVNELIVNNSAVSYE